MLDTQGFRPDLQTQIELEELYHSNQTLPRLRREFSVPEIVQRAEEAGLPVKFTVDLLSHMVLHKRAGVSVLVGILHHHFMEGDERDRVPEVEELQACADACLKAAEMDFVDLDLFRNEFVLRIDVTDDVYAELERYQFPLPLLVEPRKVETNRDTGYHSEGSRKGSVLLSGHFHEDDVCLDHLNRVNRMRLSVNPETVAMVQNKWRHLDKPKEGESQEKYQARVRAFEKYDRISREVIDHLMVMGNEFHLTHRYDTRGRCYAVGYHINPQGNDWSKSIVEFTEKEVIQE